MKFRLLTQDELSYFDEDFKHFLIINGIHNEEWVKLNQNNPEKALDLLKLFSDIVLQKVFEKIHYLEFRSKEKLFVFNCEESEIHLIGLQSDDDQIDFSTTESIQYSLTNHPSAIQFFNQSKGYSKNREQEIFELMERGCIQSSMDFYIALQNVIKR
jgi:hypothetical protein